MNRRARTRHLIELGGLVVKAGLVELSGDDRAVAVGRVSGDRRQLQARTASKLSHYGGGEEVGRLNLLSMASLSRFVGTSSVIPWSNNWRRASQTNREKSWI